MPSMPECQQPQGRTEILLVAAVLLTAMLSACAGNGAGPVAGPARLGQAVPHHANPASPSNSPLATPATEPSVAPANVAALPPDALTRALAYADRVRQMTPAELNVETSRLTTPTSSFEQFQLATALSQQRQLPELVRAQELLARVLANNDAQALHPLARLLAARFAEQRRLEELLDKQSQQTRDVQRRLDQTTERLQALKAIERSLTSRPATSAPAPRSTP